MGRLPTGSGEKHERLSAGDGSTAVILAKHQPQMPRCRIYPGGGAGVKCTERRDTGKGRIDCRQVAEFNDQDERENWHGSSEMGDVDVWNVEESCSG
jgi:hypothetical protein